MLKNEVLHFLSESNTDLVKYFQDKNGLCKFCHLSGVFEKLNNLNLSLQGENSNIFTLIFKIEAFMKKIGT